MSGTSKKFIYVGLLFFSGSAVYATCPAGTTMMNQSGNADVVVSFSGIYQGAAGAARALGPPQGGGFSLTNWAFIFPTTGELVLDMTDLIPENSTIVLRVGERPNNPVNVSTSNDLITFTAPTVVSSNTGGSNVNYTVAAGSGGARYLRFQDVTNSSPLWFAIDGITYSEICEPNPVVDLSITKDDGNATYTPGGTATYTIVVTNNGPDDVTGATIADDLPDGVTMTGPWTCTPSSGSSGCNTASNMTDPISIDVDIINGDFITVTIPVQFSSNMGDY